MPITKNRHADYWEIRAGLKDRILFEFTDKTTFFMVAAMMRSRGL
jgi:hypothetical protein